MTHVIILSAGQGKRLSPLTDNKPKCLINIAGKTLLEWQLHALKACGIENVTVVTGFGSKSIETAIKLMPIDLSIECLFNPFYSVADNISSCWTARHRFDHDTILINGDTLFDQRILTSVLSCADSPITVTVDRKSSYDSDDMKVQTDGLSLKRIGKSLEGAIDGESIGMLRFLGNGGGRFTDTMENLLRDPAALKLWYLSIIDQMAINGEVAVHSIEGLEWTEVDFPHDVALAAQKVKNFLWVDGFTDSKKTQRF